MVHIDCGEDIELVKRNDFSEMTNFIQQSMLNEYYLLVYTLLILSLLQTFIKVIITR